jgi:hypothetical protein
VGRGHFSSCLLYCHHGSVMEHAVVSEVWHIIGSSDNAYDLVIQLWHSCSRTMRVYGDTCFDIRFPSPRHVVPYDSLCFRLALALDTDLGLLLRYSFRIVTRVGPRSDV